MKPAVNCRIGRKNRSDCCIKPLEELFRARVITFLLDKGLLPPERVSTGPKAISYLNVFYKYSHFY